MSEGGIAEGFADGEILKIYAEGQFLKKAVLAGYCPELAAEIAAVDEGGINAQDVMEQTEFEPAGIEEMTGGGSVLPSRGVGAYVQEEL